MGVFYIINDLSVSRWRTANVLGQLASHLQAFNIFAAPFNSRQPSLNPDHTWLWAPPAAGQELGQEARKAWRGIDAMLASGKNVLCYNSALSQKAIEFFYGRVREQVLAGGHQLRTLLILGAPHMLFEGVFRSTPVWADKNKAAYARRLGQLAEMPDFIRAAQGDGALRVVGNYEANLHGPLPDSLLQDVFAFLNVPMPAAMPSIAPPEALKSSPLRRIRKNLRVRDNCWPFLDEELCGRVLTTLDDVEAEDFISPLDLRVKYGPEFDKTARKIESGLGLERKLPVSESFYVQPELQASRELPLATCEAFLAGIGESRHALRKRLEQDENLLNWDQGRLLEIARGSFAHIGEPVPALELTVLTMTYNHEKYIGQCMDSVLEQRTQFPVTHIVLDHASSDGAPGIIREYASKHSSIRPVLLGHRIFGENVRGLFNRCRSRYVALCDGDDYFTDPLKLQKQVDFLENNPDYALSFHPVMAIFENGNPPEIFPPLNTLPRRGTSKFYLRDLIRNNFIQTNSAVYRWRFQDGLPKWFRADLLPGDWYWHLLHAEKGKIGFLPEVMSVYRRHASAVYADVFKSHVALRKRLGMAELNTYKVVNEHFKGEYYKELSGLATAVLADFVQIMMDGDDSLLNKAVEKYPDFSRDFLRQLDLNPDKSKAPAR